MHGNQAQTATTLNSRSTKVYGPSRQNRAVPRLWRLCFMSVAELKIGIIDSGCSPAQRGRVLASAAFEIHGDDVRCVPARADRLGHGSRASDVVLSQVPRAGLLVAQVFHARLSTTAAQVAAALDWAVAHGAQLVNLSLGLRQPRQVLADACARALDAGVVLCAPVPAVGPMVYPANFPGILRVTGDARCASGEIAALGTRRADFGAHVRPLDGSLNGAGASMACAHLTALAARHLADGGTAATLHDWLVASSSYHGPEVLPGARS